MCFERFSSRSAGSCPRILLLRPCRPLSLQDSLLDCRDPQVFLQHNTPILSLCMHIAQVIISFGPHRPIAALLKRKPKNECNIVRKWEKYSYSGDRSPHLQSLYIVRCTVKIIVLTVVLALAVLRMGEIVSTARRPMSSLFLLSLKEAGNNLPDDLKKFIGE